MVGDWEAPPGLSVAAGDAEKQRWDGIGTQALQGSDRVLMGAAENPAQAQDTTHLWERPLMLTQVGQDSWQAQPCREHRA